MKQAKYSRSLSIAEKNSVCQAIDRQQTAIVKLAKKLISIPTVNPPGAQYDHMVDVLDRSCRGAGLTSRRYSVSKRVCASKGIPQGFPRVSLIARWNTGAAKTLHINAHYDVVPATGGWRSPPFQPFVAQGKLFGRGSEDMKANIPCMLFSVGVLRQLGIKPSVNIEFSFTPDEETGSQLGLAWLMEQNLLHADYALGEGCSGEYVAVGNKGMLWLEVEVAGKSAHGSRPYAGANAVSALVPVLVALHRLKTRVERRRTRYASKDPRDAYASMVIGGCMQGGQKVNIVPDRASVTIDRRILPEEKVKDVIVEIKNTVAQALADKNGASWRLKILARESPVISPHDEHYLSVFGSALHRVCGQRMKTAVMPGGTDMRFFIRKGIPALGYSVQGGQRCHADNEFVYVKSILETTKVFSLMMGEL